MWLIWFERLRLRCWMIPSSLTLSSCSMQWNELQHKNYGRGVEWKKLWQWQYKMEGSCTLVTVWSLISVLWVDQLLSKYSVLVVARLNSSFELENTSISVHGLNVQGFQLVFELFAKSTSMQCHEIRLIFEASCSESSNASLNQDIAIHLCIDGSSRTEIR